MKKLTMKKLQFTAVAEKVARTKKRKVPVLSASSKNLFAAIETSPVFGEEAFLVRHSNIKKNG